VVSGARDGYKELCQALPAVVIAVDEGGALLEAWTESNNHTWTIFRDTTVYLNDPNLDDSNVVGAIEKANTFYGLLRHKWLQNPADFYTVLNEPAANDASKMPVYAAYQLRMMELAEEDDFDLCILNLAGGTPGDFSLWEQHYVPVIERAATARHIYGRHAYGGNLVPIDGNTGRPMQEALYLEDHNINCGIAITECGFNGGYGFVGVDEFVTQSASYERILRTYPNIIGACMWTLGDWNGANFQSASIPLAEYMTANPTEPWNPDEDPQEDPCKGKPRIDYPRTYNVIPVTATIERATQIFMERWAASKESCGGSYDDAGIGALTRITANLWDIPPADRQEFKNFYEKFYPGVDVVFMPEDNIPPSPVGDALIGLHARADGGHISNEEVAEFSASRADVIKVLSSHSAESVTRLAQERPNAVFIIRAFLSFRDSDGGMRFISPDQFFNDTITDINRTIAAIGDDRKIHLEIHNEPNLYEEGLGSSWMDGGQFTDWLLVVRRMYEEVLPESIEYIYPGLSPGPSIGGIRQGHIQFMNDSAAAVEACDSLGVHLYWSQAMPMTQAYAVLNTYISRFPGKPIWVTEASRNDRPEMLPPEAYGMEYVAFWQELSRLPDIRGVTYFIATASNPVFAPEAWVTESGAAKGIGTVVGNRHLAGALSLEDMIDD
jgi:hypothetical protein